VRRAGLTLLPFFFLVLITGCGAGLCLNEETCPIRGSFGSFVSYFNQTGVVVTPVSPKISIAPSKPGLVVGATVQLQGTYTLVETRLSTDSLTFTSADPSIASVTPSGLVTGVATGIVVITATEIGGVSGNKTVVVTNMASSALHFGSVCAHGTSCHYLNVVEGVDASMACSSGTLTVISALYYFGAATQDCTGNVSAACTGQTSCAPQFSIADCGGDPSPGDTKLGWAVVSCN